MDVTKSQNPNAMTLGSAKIEVSFDQPLITAGAAKDYQLAGLSDLGLARGVVITPSSTQIEVLADNGTAPLAGQTGKKVTVTFSLLERHIPVIGKLMKGLVTVKSEPGTRAAFTDSYAAGVIKSGMSMPFRKTNFDGAPPENVTVTQGAVTLVEGSDYAVTEYAGAYFVTIISPDDTGIFDSAKALKVVYDATPAKSYTMSQGSSGIASHLSMRLTNKRKSDDGRIISRTWELPYGVYKTDDTITLKSKNDADSVAEVPMSFEFTPHPDMVNDAELEPMSLMRETQEV